MAGKKATENPGGGVDPFAVDAMQYTEVDAEGMTDVIAAGARVRLTVLSDPTPNGTSDVFLGVNGYGIQVKRDEPVDLPACYVPLLNVTETRYELNADGVYVPREVPRFNYRVEISPEMLRRSVGANAAPVAGATPAAE